MIAIQSTLTGVLAICIAVNAIYALCTENPHEKRRKEVEAEKLKGSKDGDEELTPLDARNSLLNSARNSMLSGFYPGKKDDGRGKYQPTPTCDTFYTNENERGSGEEMELGHRRENSKKGLVGNAAEINGWGKYRDHDDEWDGKPVSVETGPGRV